MPPIHAKKCDNQIKESTMHIQLYINTWHKILSPWKDSDRIIPQLKRWQVHHRSQQRYHHHKCQQGELGIHSLPKSLNYIKLNIKKHNDQKRIRISPPKNESRSNLLDHMRINFWRVDPDTNLVGSIY